MIIRDFLWQDLCCLPSHPAQPAPAPACQNAGACLSVHARARGSLTGAVHLANNPLKGFPYHRHISKLATTTSEGLGAYAMRNAETPAVQQVQPTQQAAQKPTWSQIAKSLVAGGIAGGVSRTAVAPLERLKILQQVATGHQHMYRSTWKGLLYMARNEGIRGMMKGNGANCVRIIPNSAVKFFTYEHLSREIVEYYRQTTGKGEMTPFLRLMAGAGAGIVGMSATYPLDMVRGRLTVQSGQGAQYRGIWHATTVILKEEGIGAFYRGWLPSVIGVIPYVGLNFAVYETLKAMMLTHYGLNDERELSLGARLACGAVAGTTGQTVAYPFDVARRRLQVSGWQGMKALAGNTGGSPVVYTGMVDCFVRTVREEGFRALFKGLAPNYVKVVPSIAIAFVTYEQVKQALGVEFRISE